MSDTPANENNDPTPRAEDPASPQADELGDGGKKALAAERSARKEAEKALAEITKKFEEAETAKLPEQERAIAEAASAAAAKVEAEYSAKMLAANVRAAAGSKFVDPDVVLTLLDQSNIAGPDDTQGINAALDELAKSKPYLMASKNVPDLPGAGNSPARPSGGGMNEALRKAALGN